MCEHEHKKKPERGAKRKGQHTNTSTHGGGGFPMCVLFHTSQVRSLLLPSSVATDLVLVDARFCSASWCVEAPVMWLSPNVDDVISLRIACSAPLRHCGGMSLAAHPVCTLLERYWLVSCSCACHVVPQLCGFHMHCGAINSTLACKQLYVRCRGLCLQLGGLSCICSSVGVVVCVASN